MEGNMSKTVVIDHDGVMKSENNVNDSISGKKRWGGKRNLSQDSNPFCHNA